MVGNRGGRLGYRVCVMVEMVVEGPAAVEFSGFGGLEAALYPLELGAGVGLGDEVAFDRAKRMQDRGAVAIEGVAELAEGEPEALACEVDRELAAPDGVGAALAAEEVIGGKMQDGADGVLDSLEGDPAPGGRLLRVDAGGVEDVAD